LDLIDVCRVYGGGESLKGYEGGVRWRDGMGLKAIVRVSARSSSVVDEFGGLPEDVLWLAVFLED